MHHILTNMNKCWEKLIDVNNLTQLQEFSHILNNYQAHCCGPIRIGSEAWVGSQFADEKCEVEV